MALAAKNRRPPRNRRPPVQQRRSSTPFILGGVVVLVVVAAVAAIALSGTGSGGRAEPAREPVAVTGTPLAALTTDADPALGHVLPTISGIGLDGEPVQIGPDDGPMAIVILAHWCQHCRAELPGLADFIAQDGVPDGVSVVGVSTAIEPVRPNYPPSAWLEREGWTQPTLVDDAGGTALDTLGVNSFPGFVFVDADGTVSQRLTGEIGVERFAQALQAIAP